MLCLVGLLKYCATFSAQQPLRVHNDQQGLNLNAKKTILVTGATGYWGGHLLAQLRKLPNVDVIGMGFKRISSADIVGDITSKGNWQKEVEQLSASHVIHLAGLSRSNDEIELHKSHIVGVTNLLESFGSTKPWFLLVSSGAVYGPKTPRMLPISENDDLAPRTAYGKSKLEKEQYLANCTDLLNGLCTVRPSNLIGPGLGANFFLGKVIHYIRLHSSDSNKSSVLNMGSLGVSRDLLDVRDASIAISLLLMKEATGIFNLSSGKEFLLRKVVAECIQRYAPHMSITEDESISPHPIKRQILGNKKISQVTGWTPTITLSQTIDDMYRYYLPHL